MSSNPDSENPVSPADRGTPPALSAEELLPPVEPPDARFIVQLFVVPAVIVAAVFLLVVAINWLTSRKEDPIAKVEAIQASNMASWQHAFELAQMLQNEAEYPELKENSELAGHLAQLLSQKIEQRNKDDDAVELRYFLCRTLGRFHVDDGLETLLNAARTDVDRDVRRSAVNAIAELGISFAKLEPPRVLNSPELVDALVELASDQENLIRSETAFALGVLSTSADADPRLTAALELLIEDVYPDARYNAALALARQGNLFATETIVEMLDANQLTFSVAAEKSSTQQAYKRNTLFHNALVATQSLLEKNPHLDQATLVAALQRFVEHAPQWIESDKVRKSLIEQAEKLLDDFAGSR